VNDRRAEVVRCPGTLRAGNKSSPAKPGPDGTVRRRATSLELVSLSAADPLNLVGIVTAGGDGTPGSGRVLYLDGAHRGAIRSEDLDRGAACARRCCGGASGLAGWCSPKSERADDDQRGPGT
jgi:hypothetical protein